jgi:hypothetical protein
VDILPPLDFLTEEKLLLKPLPVYIKCFRLPDLFAGKLHALLFRSWKNRVKGRDWYDLEWYIRSGVSPNLSHLLTRARENGDLPTSLNALSKDALKNMLIQRVETLDIEQAKFDVLRFIKDKEALNIWSKNYFKDLIRKIQ